MRFILYNSCQNLKSFDLSNFNTKNDTNLNGMFSKCGNLTSFNLSNFNSKNSTNEQYV